jgi:hypothetical protein
MACAVDRLKILRGRGHARIRAGVQLQLAERDVERKQRVLARLGLTLSVAGDRSLDAREDRQTE